MYLKWKVISFNIVAPGVPAAEGEGPAGDKPSRLGGAGESSSNKDST